MPLSRITHPDDPALTQLADALREMAPALEQPGAWVGPQLQACGEAGVFEWFIPREFGGQGWSPVDVARGYLALSAACLTTTFVITQRTGACQRIAGSDNHPAQAALLPALATGDTFATVGISHLTTSRRHLGSPVLAAEETADGFRLEGYSPWVTGAAHADCVVVGATLADGREVLLALPMDSPGVRSPAATELVGLSASRTGPVECDGVHVDRRWVLAGPVEQVMRHGAGAGTGGLQTSTLAIGLARGAVDFLLQQAVRREDLQDPAARLDAAVEQLEAALLAAASGDDGVDLGDLRRSANDLALRGSQAALAAAKGAGYVAGHPAGRWCREALFFLVWSCPQPVLSAHLCQFAAAEISA